MAEFELQHYYETRLEQEKDYKEYVEKKSGYVEVIANILKCQIGATMLAMPFTMNLCGMGYGMLIQIATTCLMLYCVSKLVKIADEVKKPNLYYPELVEQILGEKHGTIIALILGSLSVGSCIAYIIFFKAFIVEAMTRAGFEPTELEIIVITLAILVPFVFINSFHFLNKSSAFAIALMLFTIGYMMYYDVGYIQDHQNNIHLNDWFIFAGIPSYFGVAIFASEGIPCVFHLRDSMQKPRYFMRTFSSTVLTVMVIYLIFTAINIVTFGDQMQQIILMNIPYTNILSYIAKIGFAFGILLTYPVQIFPVYTMVEKTVLQISKEAVQEQQPDLYKIYGLRLSVMATVFLIAYLIPSFAGILNVLGCISGIVAQLIYPLIMDTVYQGEQKNKIIKFLDYLIVFISAVLAVVCGYLSLVDLIKGV